MNVPLFTLSIVLTTAQSSRLTVYQIFAKQFLWHIDQLFFSDVSSWQKQQSNDMIISVINCGVCVTQLYQWLMCALLLSRCLRSSVSPQPPRRLSICPGRFLQPCSCSGFDLHAVSCSSSLSERPVRWPRPSRPHPWAHPPPASL